MDFLKLMVFSTRISYPARSSKRPVSVYVKCKVQKKGWEKCRGGGEERVKVSV